MIARLAQVAQLLERVDDDDRSTEWSYSARPPKTQVRGLGFCNELLTVRV